MTGSRMLNPISDYREQNQRLLDRALKAVATRELPPSVGPLITTALEKSIKIKSQRPLPALYATLAAEDLGAADADWQTALAGACACFYAAADLFDDIQDEEPHQPVILAAGPAQAINIANLLLMCAQTLIQNLPLTADTRLHMLSATTEACLRMSIGQFADIQSTNQLRPQHTPEAIVTDKAGAEFALFLSLAGLATGVPANVQQDLSRLGLLLGSMLQIYTDFIDIWVPNPTKLSQDLAIHKNAFPLYWGRQDPRWGGQIEAWLAGRVTSGPRQLQLRRLLAQTQALEKFADFLDTAAREADRLFERLPALPRLRAIWLEELTQAKNLHAVLVELREKTQTTPGAFFRPPQLVEAHRQALDYLQLIPDHRDVWEVQRWGFLGVPRLEGSLFTPMLVLEALQAAETDIRAPLANLLTRRLEDGWHYYAGAPEIPTDTDDLGQILQLIALSGHDPGDSLETPLQLLEANLDASGSCPTWLCDAGYPREHVEASWFGNHCAGVMANLYYGLACYAPAGEPGAKLRAWSEQGLKYLIDSYDTERDAFPAAHYPSETYVAYLVSRLCRRLKQRPACLLAFEQKLRDRQRLDGSWQGSALETAFALLYLASLDSPAEPSNATVRGLHYLVDTQDYDGSWPAAPLFIRPGRDGAYETFAHAKLTTAFVLRALVASAPKGARP